MSRSTVLTGRSAHFVLVDIGVGAHEAGMTGAFVGLSLGDRNSVGLQGAILVGAPVGRFPGLCRLHGVDPATIARHNILVGFHWWHVETRFFETGTTVKAGKNQHQWKWQTGTCWRDAAAGCVGLSGGDACGRQPIGPHATRLADERGQYGVVRQHQLRAEVLPD
ncbi:hypothetical protein K438DRAFT_1792885 [Mycena galopus ATCC 62051]|nr:hypothetical protein K438DRAFT_1792885 [Mycena galopus ATCC 62051]